MFGGHHDHDPLQPCVQPRHRQRQEGRPAHVLLSIEDYQRLAGASTGGTSIVDLLAMPDDAATGIDFDPPRLNLRARPVELG